MVDQVWGDESFEDGATVYGGSPNLYVKIQPWSTQPETSTGSQLRVCNGDMTDIYQQAAGQSSGLVGPVLLNLSGGATGTAGDAVWCVERQNYRANCNVSFAPALYPLAGTPDNDSFKQFGVCSHVSGGSFVTTTAQPSSSDYYRDVSGLFLIEAKQTVSRHKVFLLRLTGGAITVLGNEEVRVTDAVHAQGNAFDFFRPAALRINVQEFGAQRRVRAYRTDLNGVEQQLFGSGFFTVSGLADGRCGFGLQTARIGSSGSQTVGVNSLFTIRDDANTSLLFADTFERTQRNLSLQRTQGALLGASAMNGWVGDQMTVAGGLSSVEQLRRDTVTANRVESGADNSISGAAGSPGFHLRQSPPLSVEQRNVVTGTRLNAELSIPTRIGVLSRVSLQPVGFGGPQAGASRGTQINGGYRTGYVASVLYDAGATNLWSLEIRHFDGTADINYQGDVLATADLTAFGLLVGTAFTVDLETRNFDGNQLGQGTFVSLRTKVNGGLVTPVAANLAGIAEQGDNLIDLRSVSTGNRGGVGFFLYHETAGTAGELFAVSSFAAATLTDPPVARPDEQVSVSVQPEAAGAVGTLAIPIDARVEERLSPSSWRHTFESGKEQTIANQALSRRTWRVGAIMHTSEWEALQALLASNGAHTPFNWTHPYTGAAHVVLFGSDEITFSENGADEYGYNASFELIEVFTQQTYNPEL
ncbi:phage tail protein [bacterium]|nr:phage tail protein [bacterium]